MEQTGFAYLYVLAALGMTFATMSAIVVVLRQTTGVPLSRMQRYLTRLYVESGFLVSGLALLPMLVDLFDLSRPAVWRVCSAVFAAIGGVHTAALPRRYRAAAESAPPLRVYVHRGVRWLLLLALLLTAVGVPHLPGVGLYGLAVTYWLGQVCHVFCTRLSEFQSEAPVADQGLPLAAPASP